MPKIRPWNRAKHIEGKEIEVSESDIHSITPFDIVNPNNREDVIHGSAIQLKNPNTGKADIRHIVKDGVDVTMPLFNYQSPMRTNTPKPPAPSTPPAAGTSFKGG